MILLDTNIVSEVMRSSPDERVLLWVNDLNPGSVFLSAVSVAEIHFGLAVMPAGRRRTALRQRFEHFVTIGFAERVLPFDERAALEYGDLMARRRKMGKPMGVADGQIVATAAVEGYALATRNRKDFEECSVELINPFAE